MQHQLESVTTTVQNATTFIILTDIKQELNS